MSIKTGQRSEYVKNESRGYEMLAIETCCMDRGPNMLKTNHAAMKCWLLKPVVYQFIIKYILDSLPRCVTQQCTEKIEIKYTEKNISKNPNNSKIYCRLTSLKMTISQIHISL